MKPPSTDCKNTDFNGIVKKFPHEVRRVLSFVGCDSGIRGVSFLDPRSSEHPSNESPGDDISHIVAFFCRIVSLLAGTIVNRQNTDRIDDSRPVFLHAW